MYTAAALGEDKFNRFFKKRLCSEDESLYDVLKKNKLQLFKQSNLSVGHKSKEKMKNLTADRKLFSRLFIACQTRKGDLKNFFAHENHSYPVSISEFGKLRKCSSKSDFLKCLQKISEPCETPPEDVQMKNVDGAAFVNMNSPRESSSFKDYCEELKKKVKKIGDNVERVDMIFDVYRENSLKSHTRESRGKGLRISIRKNTPIPKDFQKFLRDDDNKNELFQMLADSFLDVQNLIVVSTKSEKAVSNVLTDLRQVDGSNHEEADTRMFVHVKDGCSRGYRNLTIVTVDTDVVVIALFHYFSFDLDKLWIEFGVGKNKRYLRNVILLLLLLCTFL